MKYINKLIIGTAIMFPVICYSQVSNDFWRVNTDVYMEIEEYRGQKDTYKNKVYDKVSTIGKLELTNPESKWRFSLEHRETLRNHGKNFSASRDSYIRNRTQIGATREFVKTDDSEINVNFTYRKESNDSVPGTKARSSNSLYWIMPSGSHKINDKWSFDVWSAFYYYSNFYQSDNYEWESEIGATYQIAKPIKMKVMLYHDRTWDNDANLTFQQTQARVYLPITLNQEWSIAPYFRYYLYDQSYDSIGQVTQKVKNGYRIGTKAEYKITPKLSLWGGVAFEPTTWKYPKNNGVTMGSNNKQTLYLGQLGVKYTWQ